MARSVVLEASEVFDVLAGSAAVSIGELVYDDGTDWELADADAGTDGTGYAQMIAVSDAPSGGNLKVARRAVIRDSDDNSFSSSTTDVLYLSDTAGAITSTRPTGANDVKQVVGHAFKENGGTGAQIAVIDIRGPYEQTINLQYPYVESAAPQDADNDFHGVGLDDTSAAVGACFMFPENCVGVEIAYSWHSGTGTELDSSDTVTFDVSAGVDDETTSATTDGISATALTVAANDLARIDISAAFDGAGIVEPGNVAALDIKKAAEGTAGDDPIMLCSSVVALVV